MENYRTIDIGPFVQYYQTWSSVKIVTCLEGSTSVKVVWIVETFVKVESLYQGTNCQSEQKLCSS